MIISCINCSKKFEVESSLIPKNGRKIQCGSCNHIWFFVTDLKVDLNELPASNPSEINNGAEELDNKEEFIATDNIDKKIFRKDLTPKIKTKDVYTNKTNKKKNIFSFGKFLSYLIVLIISFVALIIIIDTFESPLKTIFPNVDLLMNSLYETLHDVVLFIKDLFY